MKKKVFISYNHKDSKKVKDFALRLSLYGFDLWMDEKLEHGANFTTRIMNKIQESDIYLVFLSSTALKSRWIEAEIDFALHEKIEKGKLAIIPVLLENIEIPSSLSNLNCLNASFSLEQAAKDLSAEFENEKILHNDITASSVAFSISKDTTIQVSPFIDSVTIYDLEKDREFVLSELRKKAYGILMNFVSAADFDFTSEKPRFTNGLYEEKIVKKSGDTSGSFCENVTVETVVFNPSLDKVKRLINKRIEILNINAITFGFSIPLKKGESLLDIGKRCFQKIQEKYVILSYDSIEGAKFEISKDFYISLLFTEEIMKIKLTTQYDFQFEDKIKGFSVIGFIKDLFEQCDVKLNLNV